MSTPSQQIDPRQLNDMQRNAVLSRSVEMCQQIFSQTISDPSKGAVVHIQPRNVGLLKRFLVVVKATANNTDGADAATPSDFGLANTLSNISFTDLNNNQRIATSGVHCYNVASAKKHKAFGSVFEGADLLAAGSFGDNFGVLLKPASIAKGASDSIRCIYEIPIAYSDNDLRGAIYMNVVNATASLDLTINTAAFADAGADSTFAVYKGAAGNLTDVTITVYQVYLDQLPVGKNGVILPALDLSTVYELKETQFNKIAAAADFPVPYANFRDFVSTFAIYNSDNSADAGRDGGDDVNYFALQSANFTNIWKIDPVVAAYFSRNLLGTDFPNGCYYFDHRKKPISTLQYGNMELVLNAKTAAASNFLRIGWEDFAVTNTLTQAGSLAAAQ